MADGTSGANAPTLRRRVAYASASSALAAVLLAIVGEGSIGWNTPAYWCSVVAVFVVAVAIYGKVD